MGCIIETQGVTGAIKARDLLRKNRFGALIEKKLVNNKKGCTYAVRITGDCEGAVDLLNRYGINFK